MRPIEWWRGERANVANLIHLTDGMKLYSNGDDDDVTEEIKGMNLAYLAELDELIAKYKYDPRYA